MFSVRKAATLSECWATSPISVRDRFISRRERSKRKGSDVAHAEGDYGTRFLAAAGVLNLLAALHAYEAARGRKA